MGAAGSSLWVLLQPTSSPWGFPLHSFFHGEGFSPYLLLVRALARCTMGSKQEFTALIRGSKSSLTAHLAALGLEVMAIDSLVALPYLHRGDEWGADLRTVRDGIWQWNELLCLLMWVCRAIPADLLSQSHLQCLTAAKPLLEGRRLAWHRMAQGGGGIGWAWGVSMGIARH